MRRALRFLWYNLKLGLALMDLNGLEADGEYLVLRPNVFDFDAVVGPVIIKLGPSQMEVRRQRIAELRSEVTLLRIEINLLRHKGEGCGNG